MPHSTKLRSRRILSRLLACLALFLLTAVPLHAHHLPPGMEDVDEFDDGTAFMTGLRHPLLGMDHWMFAIIIGAVAAAGMTRFNRLATLTALLTAMVIGAVLGLNGIVLTGPFMACLAALMIVLVMPSSTLHWSVLKLLLISLAAFWQGNQHGIAWPLEFGIEWYLVGLVVTTAALAFGGATLLRLASGTARLPRHARVTSH